jgi:signal peptidase I
LFAKARNKSGATEEPIVVEYAKSFFPVLFIVLMLRSFVIEPFQIPSGSMIPTLEVGDFILVNKYHYGLRLPVVGTKIVENNAPQRGEVMVFIPPHDPRYFIKRVVGLPGDRIDYENKILRINGEQVEVDIVDEVMIETAVGMRSGILFNEQLGLVNHNAQIVASDTRGSSRTSWIVPPGHYFMMGDNRDNSADSRVWGPVPEENIVGKAIAVWMHKDPGFNLPTFSRNQRIY